MRTIPICGTRQFPTGACVLVLLWACLAPSVTAGPPDGPETDVLTRIDAIIEQAMAEGPIAGLSLLVAEGDDIILDRGYGFADLELDVPAEAHTVYRLGSLTKQFTAVAVLQLIEKGKIGLDEDITIYLPDYPTQGRRVTVRHLLQHTSGIVSYTGQSDYWRNIRIDLPHKEVLSWFKDKPFQFEPGDRYIYNNSGYYLLGLIIEAVSGQSYEQYLRDHIFGPLGLRQTYYASNRAIIKQRARGYTVSEGNLVNARWLSMKMPFSTGGLASTVHDLFRLHRALKAHRILNEESYRLMTTPGTLNDGESIEYGVALHIEHAGPHLVYRHGGVIFGFKVCYYHYPESDLTLIIFTNTEQTKYRPIQHAIASLFLDGLPPSEDWK